MPDQINIRLDRDTHLELKAATAALSRLAGTSLTASEAVDVLIKVWKDGDPKVARAYLPEREETTA